jgi:hypothetical protein
MRPTDLGFRSPKERTAEYNYPSVTFDGRALPLLSLANKPSIPKSKRFIQYDLAARRTSASVGPGAYDLRTDPLKQWSIAGTPLIKPYCAIKDPTNNGYYFIGNHMVYDPNFAKRPKKSSQMSFINNEIRPRLLSTSSTRTNQIKMEDSLAKMKNSPYLAHRFNAKPII